MSATDVRRARLIERRGRLSPGQQARLERRLSAAPDGTPDPDAAGCLVAIRPSGSRAPLFCVHPAGGDVMCYVALGRRLHAEQPLFAFQSPGLHAAEAPLPTIEALAARYALDLKAVQAAGPYHLCGWSLGGAVAFEMARQLHAQAEAVELLAIVDTVPSGAYLPGSQPAWEEADNQRWLLAVAEYVEKLWGHALGVTESDLARLRPEEQMRHFLARLQATGVLRGEATLAQLRRLIEVFKANTRAWYAYAPQPGDARLTLFKARERSAGEALIEDELMGWGGLSPGPVDVHSVPGDHVSLMAEPNVRVLADGLEACLSRAAHSRQPTVEGRE